MTTEPSTPPMTALVVIDVQNEFTDDPRLGSQLKPFLQGVDFLLKYFRKHQLPVIHIHYLTEADGKGYLVHHAAEGRMRCLRGSREAEPHPKAHPQAGEPIFSKYAYSAFTSPEFEAHLQEHGINSLLLCGLFEHVCVRQTAIQAIEKSFRVCIAQDAVASYDPPHATITRSFLIHHGVHYTEYLKVESWLNRSEKKPKFSTYTAKPYPVACVDGQWIQATTEPTVEHRNPSNWNQILGSVPSANRTLIHSAASSATGAQKEWKILPLQKRLNIVWQWVHSLEEKADEFIPLMVKEVGKPISACQFELELLRESIGVMRDTFTEEAHTRICKQTTEQMASARRCPLGVVAIIAPWNNPVFLPASKIAAAIALGNAVVWKPALPGTETSIRLQNSIEEAGIPTGLVNLVFGGSDAADELIKLPEINAVTLTGSIETGKQVAATCGSLLKPLQAELGGNNAAIVTEDCDLKEVAYKIAHSAFGYSGQACTATRRLILFESIEEAFIDHLKSAIAAMKIGLPTDRDTLIGPVISKSKQETINQLVEASCENENVFELPLPDTLPASGCWLPPRIIQGLNETNRLIQEESFSPILTVQTVANLAEAIQLSNSVPNGLIASIFCDNERMLQSFQNEVEAGVVQLNLPSRNLHMESPFGGWKDSGLGTPEHGIWDLDFYTQWQAINRKQL